MEPGCGVQSDPSDSAFEVDLLDSDLLDSPAGHLGFNSLRWESKQTPISVREVSRFLQSAADSDLNSPLLGLQERVVANYFWRQLGVQTVFWTPFGFISVLL